MDANITTAAFNALPFSEQMEYLTKAGRIIRADEGVTIYRVMDLDVEVRMEWTPLRITSVKALEPGTPAAA